MKYDSYITLSHDSTKYINHLLTTEPKNEEECFGEDETYIETAHFDNGMEADIKICGVQFEDYTKEDLESGCTNTPWTEAVLFNELGGEVAHSEPESEFFGDWEFEFNGDNYIVHVNRYTED